MTDYNEVLKDFQSFITGKTAEDKELILNLLEEWTESLILGGVGSENIGNDKRI